MNMMMMMMRLSESESSIGSFRLIHPASHSFNSYSIGKRCLKRNAQTALDSNFLSRSAVPIATVAVVPI